VSVDRLVVRQSEHRLTPDARRVLAKPFAPGEEMVGGGHSRARVFMERVLAIPEEDVAGLLAEILADFSSRHRDFQALLHHHFGLVAHHIDAPADLSPERRLLIGAYFTHEYSVEGAALFNPSIVRAPDQGEVGGGEQRFVMSLRAVGEGHISSIEFRSGVVDAGGSVAFDRCSSWLGTGERASPVGYGRRQFKEKLNELGAGNSLAADVLARLPDPFTLEELERCLVRLETDGPPHAIIYETVKIIRMLAASSYTVTFARDSAIDERVIFPAGPHESRGMEDARFVRFSEPDGGVRYYATYTAYDGFEILPQLIETEDFVSFEVSTLHGAAAQNKGMALFPRQIDGNYVMLSRKDRENLYLSVSDDVHCWEDATELHRPSEPWELLQIGNCGSPIETEAGWLVLTHGVGPVRRYVIGAVLLDLDDPHRVVARLPEPLLAPGPTEREGYVPNVLYSCGALVHGDHLILPYGFSDSGVCIATISLPDLLAELRAG
jgi:predicted GH43/DUF377 family glycosyl hydrolase